MKLELLFPNIRPEQIVQIEQYCELLREWNQRVNLVSRQDVGRLMAHHILPSLIPLRLINLAPGSWVLDIGSGGGLPAIPLKIMRPDLQVLMVDSVRKKTLFLKKAIADLGLSGISADNRRIEELSAEVDLRKKFDIITARAVGRIGPLIEWGEPFRKDHGFYLLWKGMSDIAELESGAAEGNYSYQIFSVPEALQQLSPKFRELCWFRIDLPATK